MIFTYAVAICIAAVWISRMILAEKIIWRNTLLFWPVALYILGHILSTIFSIHPHTSIFGYYSRFHGGLLSTITYSVMFFAAVSNLSWHDVPKLIRTSLIATLLICLYAIPEHFGVSPSCILITGEATVGCWVQDVQTRVFATFGQPNWLAAYLLMMIPLAWWYAATQWQEVVNSWKESFDALIKSVEFWQFLLGLTSLLLSVVTILYTRSRSGFLGLAFEIGFLVLALGLLFIRQLYMRSQKKISGFFLPLGGSLVVATLLIGILGSPFTPSVQQLSQQLFNQFQASENASVIPESSPVPTTAPVPSSGTVLENGGTDSGDIRRIVWKGALLVWKRYPLFGSGLDTFAYSYYFDRPAEHNHVSEWDFLYNRAHNEFLNTLATTGAFGFLGLLFLMGFFVVGVLRDIWKLLTVKQDPHVPPQMSASLPAFLLLALLAGYGGLAISNFFGFSTVVVAALFFLYKSWWEILHRAWKHPEDTEFADLKNVSTKGAAQLIETPQRKKKRKNKYISSKKTTRSRTGSVSAKFTWSNQWWGVMGVGVVALFLLSRVWHMWQSDHLLALAKGYISQGAGVEAYNTIEKLVQQAPFEPTYVDEQSITLARLAAGTYEQDATTAARLAQKAVEASDQAIKLNPVHLNFWKNRARVFIMLGGMDSQYYLRALEALHRGRELAPTDVKLLYNIGLVLDALGENASAREAYQDTLALKPDYEEARNSYALLLERQGDYQAAVEQYQYILDYLNPTAPTATEKLEALTATLSAELNSSSSEE